MNQIYLLIWEIHRNLNIKLFTPNSSVFRLNSDFILEIIDGYTNSVRNARNDGMIFFSLFDISPFQVIWWVFTSNYVEWENKQSI